MSTHTDDHDRPQARGTGYEPRDAQPLPVLITGISLLVMMVVGLIGAIWFYDVFRDIETGRRPEPSPVYDRQIPPGALLQGAPDQELLDYVTSQVEFLHSYGWVDTTLGIVHVPVHRAMERVLEEGLPRWREPEQPDSEDARDEAASASASPTAGTDSAERPTGEPASEP
ncbi:MAG: hypothetical protein ACFB9M_04210 [Myxococcota bacterium]